MIPPCEPLKIPEINIKQNAGAIRIESQYSDMVIAGFSNFTLRDISVDVAKKRLQADLWFPELGMTSNYLIHGKLLLMPITGSGKAYGNFSEYPFNWPLIQVFECFVNKNRFQNCFVLADVDATVVMHKKDNSTTTEQQQHRDDGKNDRSCDIKVEFNIGNASVKLDNLFNGDDELGSMMNQFLNNNWREITAEIRPALAESIENILCGIATQLNEMYDLDNIINEE